MDGGQTALTRKSLEDAFAREIGAQSLGEMEQAFLAQAHDDYIEDEAPGIDGAAFARILARFWAFAEERQAGSPPAVRVRPAHEAEVDAPYDLIEIVQDDGPFLVDSVMGDLAEAGVSVRAMFHPLIGCRRAEGGERKPCAETRESMILVIVDPMTQERRDAIRRGLNETLADVRMAVDDHTAMAELMAESIERLEAGAPGVDRDTLDEGVAFLRWLEAEHFVFLGARDVDYPRDDKGGYATHEALRQRIDGLGVLRDLSRPILRQTHETASLSSALQRRAENGEPVVVAKANLRSRVHRRVHMDYVSVLRYGDDGRPSGETRFVGLFTSEAYDKAAFDVPLVRAKAKNVLARADKAEGTHNHKRLKNILETFPRDELFQVGEDELLSTTLGILHLNDRPRVKLFTRKDPFDRFLSILAYVPRDRYDAGVRERIGRILAEAWGGRMSAFYPQLSEAPLVRVHYIIGVTPNAHPEPDPAELERRVVEAARGWADRFEQAARDLGLADAGIGALTRNWAEAFPAGYRDRYDAREALTDLGEVDRLGAADVVVRAFRTPADSNLQFRFKLYRRGRPAPLAEVLPILSDMGLKALEEYGHAVRPGEGDPIYIHEFLLEDPRGSDLVFADVKDPFEAAFSAVWAEHTESDGFNRLVLELGVGWRDAALVRALAKYRQQSGLDPSQATQEEALREYPGVSRKILEIFRAKFDPDRDGDAEARGKIVDKLFAQAEAGLQAVKSLDHDRVLRRLLLLVMAIKRTNFYQTSGDPDHPAKPYISFKVASRELADLPAPKPYREIFVWAPHIEGVHLRFGPVARGGLRWSDRRDDFRTEVLGLVKAQQVKNAVIVPVGSKGGFFAKHQARVAKASGGDRDAIQQEGIRAYRTFLSGLLDITDNILSDGSVKRPDRVVAWEGDDPYLVVAADKGTATFSDIANGISESYGFWLGDAFASGGSAGYDHKVMGITARGAWEAVKRHFMEMGKDIQSEPFTVVGVGDMAGDVFGNGMLLSKQIRLVAAFNHMHIFIDPDPDPASSWVERDRLFKLPRSTWADYDASKISKGGGVFSRDEKSLKLTPEIKAVLDIEEDELTPADLMRAILKSNTELLYLGGIGTYVRAPNETDLQVGDKANDAIRVEAGELRVKVIGEGANLGLTQAGRIAFARNGGRINTDAIDNSAGVDSSDHEVNIKILTGAVEAAGKLDRAKRNVLLASMTDEVAHKVLAHNYDQTLAVSLQERTAAADVDAHARFMARLEQAGKLDRKVEGLPTAQQMADLAQAGLGLTRPELAVLTAYGKLELDAEIVAGKAPDDPFFEETLVRYFPGPLAVYEDEMQRHRLRREIISTVLSNEIVNMCGATFGSRLKQSADGDTDSLVTAFEAARRVFRLDEAWDAVSALDLKIPAEAQLALYGEIQIVLRRQTFWLARRARGSSGGVQALIDAYRPAADALRTQGATVLSSFGKDLYEQRAQGFIAAGAPEDLARAVAMLRPLTATSDIGDLANALGWDAPAMARLYHQVGLALGFDRLRQAAGSLVTRDHFERLAVRRLIEDLMAEQSSLTRAVAANATAADGADEVRAGKVVTDWIGPRASTVDQVRHTIDEIDQAGQGWSFAKLTIANVALRDLATSA